MIYECGLYESVRYAINGKSWYDAKRKARSLYKKSLKKAAHPVQTLTAAASALIDYHAVMYGRGLCDIDAIYEYLEA